MVVPREESGARREEEEPSAALGFNCAGGVAGPSASEEATWVSGVGGSGGAKGGWRVLGVEGETLRKELGMGEGAGGGGALIRRLPSALERTLGLGRPSLRVEAVEDFFFTAILDWCFLGEEGPRTGVLEGVEVLSGGGALVALAALKEIFL